MHLFIRLHFAFIHQVALSHVPQKAIGLGGLESKVPRVGSVKEYVSVDGTPAFRSMLPGVHPDPGTLTYVSILLVLIDKICISSPTP